jgi:GT2 family glycosyltransferase
MPTLTIVIATFQRRRSLARLLAGLRTELEHDPRLRDGLDVIVVVDGSTDGTLELCESLDFSVPVKTVSQRNRGRAAARNVGLGLATGEIVWFLDDDVVPLAGLIRRHREAHESAEPHVLTGPYMFEESRGSLVPNQKWVDLIYAEMTSSGCVDRADWFSSANASGPAETFREAGAFDEGFTGWGFEDTDLGYRLLRYGVPIRFDPLARALHQQDLTLEQFCANSVNAGRNLARLLAVHPELVDELLAVETAVPSRRRARAVAGALYRLLPVRSPLAFRTIAAAAMAAARVELNVTNNRSQRALYVAMVSSTLAGLAEADPTGVLVARKFGIVTC